jgi:hypothetical protein
VTVYGVLGENNSDTATLKELIRRIAADDRLPIMTKGYEGGAEMLRKGAVQLQLFADLDCNRFVICYDADHNDPELCRRLIHERVVLKSGIALPCCVVIPVQELEAWILADIEAAKNIFTSWSPEPVRSPELIESPKEHIEKLSRDAKRKPRYSHATHNERMAKHIDLGKVHSACPSFRPLYDFVRMG